MNKTQLVDVVAKEAQMKKKDAEAAVEAVFAAIADAIADGDKVQIIGRLLRHRECVPAHSSRRASCNSSYRPCISP